MNMHNRVASIAFRGLLVGLCLALPQRVWAQFEIELEKPPFEYSETLHNNRVSRMLDRIAAGELEITYDAKHGNLRSLLSALEVPVSSQTLVFSKTSLQVAHISRTNPRAIYFNDDTYVGWVRGSELMEISTHDPSLGAAFYTVRMRSTRPKIERAYYDCLGCHATSMTQAVPGHVVRSVYPMADSNIDMQRKSFITDHKSPLSDRWGGWYVTGSHGEATHMGNTFLRGGMWDARTNGNKSQLNRFFDTEDWLRPDSDIVALMVLEHQTQLQNTFTQSQFLIRKLLYEQTLADRDGDRSLATNSIDTLAWQLDGAAEKIVEGLLFCGEAKLSSSIVGNGEFTKEFEARGPVDGQGRSLRQFDLTHRMFRYPCSYQIYSSAFDGLHPLLRTAVYKRLREVLTSEVTTGKFQHLDAQVRHDILSILEDTKTEFAQSTQLKTGQLGERDAISAFIADARGNR